MSERLPGWAEAARRNDLAMDVARLWQVARKMRAVRGDTGAVEELPGFLVDALDRLAEAYDFNTSEEQR